MQVHLGEETYSHRDPDESDFPTALTCQCLLENGVGSEKSIPIDPQIFVVANESQRLEVSQFQCLSV